MTEFRSRGLSLTENARLFSKKARRSPKEVCSFSQEGFAVHPKEGGPFAQKARHPPIQIFSKVDESIRTDPIESYARGSNPGTVTPGDCDAILTPDAAAS